MDTTRTALNWKQLNPAIGAEVKAPKADLLSGVHAAELRELLERRGVLVFPRVDFSPEEQVIFTRTLGNFVADTPDNSAYAITMDPSNWSAELLKGSFFWHFDGYMNDVPILASILSCRVPAPTGGDTEFCNTYAAWEALTDEHKRQLEGLRVVHALASAQLAVEAEPSYATFSQWMRVPRSTLPLIWRHRSGRKSLVIGNSAVNILDMDPLEGLELLIWLRDWATQDRFTYSHVWSAGDAVIWDNTGTLHRATPYDPASGRLMLRTKLAGEEPFA